MTQFKVNLPSDPDLSQAIETVGEFLDLIEKKFVEVKEICTQYDIDPMTYIEWTHLSMACEEVMQLSEEMKRKR